MSAETEDKAAVHAGRRIARRLKAHGVSKLFTLSGGHLFSIYDGIKQEGGVDFVDTRHEQTAAFAAEGWAKVTRTPGVAAVTAGPGVTNSLSAIASAQSNNSPLLVLGGRAPAMRWGQGSLQEIDHIPFVRPLTKYAATPDSTEEIPSLVDEAFGRMLTPSFGPAFLDFPMDYVFMEAEDDQAPSIPVDSTAGPAVVGADFDRAVELLRTAKNPVVMAGTNLYWGKGEDALLGLIEQVKIPTFLNGMARGCVPADHELFFSRARSAGLQGADVALIIGVPMDFRLAFGAAFGVETELIVLDVAEPLRDHPRQVAAELYGALPATLNALTQAIGQGAETSAWVGELRAVEQERELADAEDMNDSRSPLHPLRVYQELNEVLDRDAIIVCDGGDFVSYAGRAVKSYVPGAWLDPGPFGCLGCGPGYALAAKLAHPDRQVVLLLGDGAFGFSGMEFDTLARHGVNVVGLIGNNGIWALEKHPMEYLYGYSVVADLRPETPYERVAEALGGYGEQVSKPNDLKPALQRAFASGKPALINALTDPTVVYPRKTNLA